MKNKPIKTRLLAVVVFAVTSMLLVQVLEKRCPERPRQVEINSDFKINNLYPWPNARIPLACHALAYLKSPFAPRLLGVTETVIKEDGFRGLGDGHREGVVVADLVIDGDIFSVFYEPVRPGKMPLFAKSISLYIDNKELEIGHISYRDIDFEFKFATILNPFLMPGKHVGKIVLLLPSGETREYEWSFEITWW